MRPIRPKRRHLRGFTLVEAIIVIVITGILAAMVAVFIRGAVTSYTDAARRAEMTDIADTALRRISRDLRLAVPNTARVTAGNKYLEILSSKVGGRYVQASSEVCFTSTQCSNLLSVGSVVETVVGTLGVPGGPSGGRYIISPLLGASDRIVIYNQYNNSSGDCSAANPSAYCGNSTSLLDASTPAADMSPAAGQDTFNFAAAQFYPAGGSPSRRFQIIDGPVTYACNPTAAVVNGVDANSLVRYSSYVIAAVQPSTALAPPLLSSPPDPPTVKNLIATNVSDCSFAYSSGVFERWGVIGLYLEVTKQSESVSLYHEVHINNVP